jgi:manganese/zinc/iron transport system permease protein
MSRFASFLTQDFPMFAAGVLASVACAIVGSFLVLRRMSLMGDAISHAVLPGIVLAFLLTRSLSTLPVLLGAALVGVLTAALSELVHRLGRVEPGAAMGVVFTVLFAIGVIMLEQTGSRTVHLDADCVLYGAMENTLWTHAPASINDFFTSRAWEGFPRQVTTLAIVLLIDAIIITVLWKELRISSFDPAMAAAQGMKPWLMHALLMTMTAMTTVASFEAVGSILVVAMLIVPGLCAHLLCDRLGALVILAGLLGAAAASVGFTVAAATDTNAAGMIGVSLGALLAIVVLFSPRYGVIVKLRRRGAANAFALSNSAS